MSELTIVYRLRFAVALAAATCLLLFAGSLTARAASPTTGEYIVQMQKGTTPAAGKRLVRVLGGRVTSPTLRVINGFGAKLSRRAAERLRHRRGVKSVSLNAGMTASATSTSGGYTCPTSDATTVAAKPAPGWGRDVDPSVLNYNDRLAQPMIHAIRADRAWYRTTGRGVGVAVIDTGIAGDIPDFQTPGWNGSRVIASAVTNPCATDATDDYGHGTHVAGLIAGNSLLYPSDNRYYGRYMGVAPRANLVSVKVSDDDGNTTVLDVIAGIQFAVDNKAQYGIRVINLSLSSNAAESYRTDPLDAAAEQAWNAGIVVVAAAGQRGAHQRRRDVLAGERPVGHHGRRARRSRNVLAAGRHPRALVEPRPDSGRPPQAGGARSGRRPRLGPGAGERLRAPVPDLHRRHALLQGRRHLDGNRRRLRRRSADPRGAPVLVARTGEGRAPGHAR